MGNFSRDTFDKLKHYVGVRLQQGVPLVDADWNEQEDIRKYELQAFLKWFVGNGVPKGNNGFCIVSIVNKIILTSNKKDIGLSSVEVKLEDSTAAEALGFGPDNYRAKRVAPPAAQLTGKIPGPFALEHKMTLAISVDDLPPVTVTFSGDDFKNISEATAAEVAEAINKAITDLTASPGEANGFDIKGGDGTPEGAGRCLVEGWDAINESDLKYTAQPLFNNAALAAKWGVDRLDPLSPPDPKKRRMDMVYLDVWEREVDEGEDYEHLVNPKIGIETCVRLKREWVVRVAEGIAPPEPPQGHVFYPLASLRRETGVAAINNEDITDLRHNGLNLAALEAEIVDARGIKGNIGNRLDESLTRGGQLRHNVVGNDQVKADAAIEESKILFSLSGGHDHDVRYLAYTGNFYFKKRKIVTGLASRSSSNSKKTNPFNLINEEDILRKKIRVRGTLKLQSQGIHLPGSYELLSFGQNTGAEVWIVMELRQFPPYYYLTTSFKCTSSNSILTLDLDSNDSGHLIGIVESDNKDIPSGFFVGMSYTLEISWASEGG